MTLTAESPTKEVPRVAGTIRITGARTHNLKNISLEIPRDQFVVVTGVSGSGKSSLVYDTLHAEGQRRYLESVSTHSRSFVEQLQRPDVDRVEGLPPTVSVSQQVGSVRPRSTLATTTEIHDFLRLVYARSGVAHSPATGSRVERQTADQIVDSVLRYPDRTKFMVLAPVVRGRKGEHKAVFEKIAKDGFVRARVDGQIVDTAEPPKLAKTKPHSIEAIVDRLIIRDGVRSRLRESIDLALKLGDGLCVISRSDGEDWLDQAFSERFVCPDTGESFPPLEPRSFSFNSMYGACPTCEGLGVVQNEEANSVASTTCPTCHGERLNRFSRLVTLEGVRLPELLAIPVAECVVWVERLLGCVLAEDQSLDMSDEGRLAAAKALPDVLTRLRYLEQVGLGYLTLDRPTKTLSGGEYQRARLSSCLGSGLIGVCYLLDEPTIGLHPRDIQRLVRTLQDLRDAGNSVVVVEHDLEVIRSADHLIDLGPGAGAEGGRVVAQGTPRIVANDPDSPTGPFLLSESAQLAKGQRTERPVTSETPALKLTNVRRHNLRGIDVTIPLGHFVAVTGVSGSGKSTLVIDVLVPSVNAVLQGNKADVDCELSSPSALQRLISIDQTPLGRTSRSTPATYSGIWDEVRKVFAKTKESRLRGFKASRFSYTSPSGRCPECKGAGTTTLEMKFLPDVVVTCPACDGRRFNRQTLSVTYRGKSAADVLSMRIDEAADFFASVPAIHRRLKVLETVGLGYITLGQSALTLSGGEAQRVRLATELGVPDQQHAPTTLFVLDEPTTGLHPRDIERLVELLQKLVDKGHTALVIEHEPSLVASADWVIDLGPEGGDLGGRIVAACSPRQLADRDDSHTGRALRPHFY